LLGQDGIISGLPPPRLAYSSRILLSHAWSDVRSNYAFTLVRAAYIVHKHCAFDVSNISMIMNLTLGSEFRDEFKINQVLL
jgi:hypothetical protein